MSRDVQAAENLRAYGLNTFVIYKKKHKNEVQVSHDEGTRAENTAKRRKRRTRPDQKARSCCSEGRGEGIAKPSVLSARIRAHQSTYIS